MVIDFSWSIDDWMAIFKRLFAEIERLFNRIKAVMDGTYNPEDWVTPTEAPEEPETESLL